MRSKKSQIEVSIIGSGNLAWHLIQLFEENEIRVNELFARKKKNASDLTGYAYDVSIQTHLDFRESRSDLFILAVSDDAIVSVASEILLPEASILVHTSGAKPMNALAVAFEKNSSLSVGVFYPLMTFTKGIRVDFNEVPFCIEGENEETRSVLFALANEFSSEVHLIDSHQRAIIHVSAVFGCNFVNHLWALSKEIVEDAEVDFEILKPLINETFKKAMKAEHPADVQTGPAVRNDDITLERHKKLIKEDDDLLKVYKTLSQSIRDWHQ
ncbi:Rossmann-like and DUF2520 domain-containing protein [Jiulongibacter sp. NS-SX5]|uniref:Rossmann-like and DUF2520 domain-containing protein n=1 Tax=Jiulongibacter sp. NS-SX5 TaxID=3463854 RepID=UPI0040594FAF